MILAKAKEINIYFYFNPYSTGLDFTHKVLKLDSREVFMKNEIKGNWKCNLKFFFFVLIFIVNNIVADMIDILLNRVVFTN